MKKFFATLLFAATIINASMCAANPTCVLMKFSATPDKNLLRLPVGLVDATKR